MESQMAKVSFNLIVAHFSLAILLMVKSMEKANGNKVGILSVTLMRVIIRTMLNVVLDCFNGLVATHILVSFVMMNVMVMAR